METRRFSRYLDWFHLLSLAGVYLTGAVYARRYNGAFFWPNLFFGFGVLLAIYFAGLAQVWSSRSFQSEDPRPSGQKTLVNARLLTLFMMGMAFAFLYTLLHAQVLIGVNLVWILAFAILSFFSTLNSITMPRNFLSWVLDGFALSPFALLLGAGAQKLAPNPRLILLCAAILLFYLAASLVMQFQRLHQDLEKKRQVLLVTMGWQRAANLALVLSLSGYLALAAYAYFTGTFNTIWPAFGLLAANLVQGILFSQMADGVRPNLPLLTSTAVIQFFGILYILIIALIR
jgi:4-hydroxybenzoate polyprenyltransferase